MAIHSLRDLNSGKIQYRGAKINKTYKSVYIASDFHIYKITVGADVGPVTLEGSADFGVGRKPGWTAYVASSLNRIVDYFRKDDKKK